MSSLKSYVIYSESNPSELEEFLSQEGTHVFEPIKAIEPSFISIFNDPSLFFNIDRSKEILGYDISNEEIAKTLSHIKCWKEIAKNSNIKDDEFILIAETDIFLADNFYQIATEYSQKYSLYDIIKLQHKHNNYNPNEKYNIEAITYSMENYYNNNGSYLYLIRKNIISKILNNLSIEKPYWKSDYFSKFPASQKIAQATYVLADLKKNHSINKEEILFSIIIPIHNAENYLETCIESVVNQNFPYYELILINDGSTDNTSNIIEKYRKRYNNITIIHKQKTGQADSKNLGINISCGEYLLFLDSDDYWTDINFLSNLSNKVKENNKLDIFLLEEECHPQLILGKNPFTVTNKLIRKDFLLKNKITFFNLYSYESILFNLELFSAKPSYSFYHLYPYHRRYTEDGIESFSSQENISSLKQSLDISLDKLQEMINRNDIDSAIISSHLIYKLYFFLISMIEKCALKDKYKEIYNKNYIKLLFSLQLQKSINPLHYYFNIDKWEGKSIAIVGSADTVFSEKRGKYIDSFDIVIRINRGVLNIINKEEYLGTKTDILFHCLVDVEDNLEVSKINPQKWKEFGVNYILYPWNDVEITIKTLEHYLNKHNSLIPIYQVNRNNFYDLRMITGEKNPTTGFSAIYLALHAKYSKIYITGFSFYRTGYQIGYSDMNAENIANHSRNSHNIDGEYEWFKAFYKKNKDRIEIDSEMKKILD